MYNVMLKFMLECDGRLPCEFDMENWSLISFITVLNSCVGVALNVPAMS